MTLSLRQVGLLQTTVCRCGDTLSELCMADGIPPLMRLVVLIWVWQVANVEPGRVGRSIRLLLSFWKCISRSGVVWKSSESRSALLRTASVNLITTSLKVNLIPVVWVRMLCISSFMATSSCDIPCLRNRGVRSSDAISRACSLRRSLLYRGLISVLGSSSGGKLRYCRDSNSSNSLLIDMRACS